MNAAAVSFHCKLEINELQMTVYKAISSLHQVLLLLFHTVVMVKFILNGAKLKVVIYGLFFDYCNFLAFFLHLLVVNNK